MLFWGMRTPAWKSVLWLESKTKEPCWQVQVLHQESYNCFPPSSFSVFSSIAKDICHQLLFFLNALSIQEADWM